MPNIKAAKKYIRTTARKTKLNNLKRRSLKEAIKKVLDLIKDGKKADAKKAFVEAQKSIDKAAKTGVLKKNTAARKKSRLVKKLK